MKQSKQGGEAARSTESGSAHPSTEALDSAYKPFKSFDSWRGTNVSAARWKERHDRILEVAGDSEAVLQNTRQLMSQIAALETGALEGLYELDRGVTITLVTSAVTWQAVLDGQPAKGLIEAQLKAYAYVLDFATGKAEIAEAWIRELHAVICAGQSDYDAIVDGRKEKRPLSLGEYKKSPNHVARSDGTYHSYCPVDQTASEMHRLIGEFRTTGFQEADPVLQAAYAHHAFVTIHPFQDGNGRTARALASVFSYRSVRIPLLFLAEMRTEYLDALEFADAGRFEPFCALVERVGEMSLELVEEGVLTAAVPSPLDAIRQAREIYRTRGGYRHEEVDRAARNLFKLATQHLTEQFNAFPADEIKGTCTPVDFQKTAAPEGYRTSIAVQNQVADCAVSTVSPAEARYNFSVIYFVPKDAAQDDTVIMQLRGKDDQQFRARLRDLIPDTSVAVQGRLALWIQRVVSLGVLSARDLADKQLRSKGF